MWMRWIMKLGCKYFKQNQLNKKVTFDRDFFISAINTR